MRQGANGKHVFEPARINLRGGFVALAPFIASLP